MKTSVRKPPRNMDSKQGRKWAESLTRLQARDISSYRDVGTYHCINRVSGGSWLTDTDFLADRVMAVPFITPFRVSTIDRIAVFTMGSVTRGRIAIYRNEDDANIYPTERFYESGAFDLINGPTTIELTCDVTLPHSTIVWFALVLEDLHYLTCLTGEAATSILGCAVGAAVSEWPNTTHLITSHTFGELPETFPDGAVASTSEAPAIAIRFSS